MQTLPSAGFDQAPAKMVSHFTAAMELSKGIIENLPNLLHQPKNSLFPKKTFSGGAIVQCYLVLVMDLASL